jgi:hypothetical protein
VIAWLFLGRLRLRLVQSVPAEIYEMSPISMPTFSITSVAQLGLMHSSEMKSKFMLWSSLVHIPLILWARLHERLMLGRIQCCASRPFDALVLVVGSYYQGFDDAIVAVL